MKELLEWIKKNVAEKDIFKIRLNPHKEHCFKIKGWILNEWAYCPNHSELLKLDEEKDFLIVFELKKHSGGHFYIISQSFEEFEKKVQKINFS